jgi:hypothetical protein
LERGIKESTRAFAIFSLFIPPAENAKLMFERSEERG